MNMSSPTVAEPAIAAASFFPIIPASASATLATWLKEALAPENGSLSPQWERVITECVCPVILYYIPFLLMCYGICLAGFTYAKPDWKSLKVQKLAGSLSMYPAFFVLIHYSHYTLMFESDYWKLGSDGYKTRLYGTTTEIDIFLNFYIATNIVQAIGQIQTEKPPLLYQLMFHHVLSIICYTTAFYFDQYKWYAVFAGCCEMTNLFLVPVFTCKEFFEEWKYQGWYVGNCIMLWWTFVTHRLVLFPLWLILWVWDNHLQHIVDAGEATSTKPDNLDIHWIESVVYPMTIVGLLVLSIIWFLAIDRGVKKTIKVYAEAKQQQQQTNKEI